MTRKKILIFLIAGMLILAIVSNAVLLTVTHFSSLQKDNVTTPGTSEYLPEKLYVEKWINSHAEYELIGNMNNLAIPVYLGWLPPDGIERTQVNNGETVTIHYKIENPASSIYTNKITINQDWFDDPTSVYYGWTFGTTYTNGTKLDGKNFTVNAGSTFEFNIWYCADIDYITPPSGVSPVNITIDSWIG